MALNTNTEVEQIRKVQNEEGAQVSPATEKQQMKTSEAVSGGNAAHVEEVTVGTNAEQLPPVAVADGSTAIVKPTTTNETLFVGTADSQPLNIEDDQYFETQVNDLSEWWVRASSAGVTVAIVTEQEADN